MGTGVNMGAPGGVIVAPDGVPPAVAGGGDLELEEADFDAALAAASSAAAFAFASAASLSCLSKSFRLFSFIFVASCSSSFFLVSMRCSFFSAFHFLSS